MPEIQGGEDVVLDEKIEEETITAQPKNISQTRSYESLWGALLFTCMLLFVIASIGSIMWIVYSQWKNEKLANTEPSIAVLSIPSNGVQESVSTNEITAQKNEQTKQTEEKTSTENAVSAKKMIITVLNGGALKGSAGTIVTFLKTEGYTNVTAGNTLKNYAGIVIYYAAGLEKEAGFIKTSLLKKYPQVAILPADVKNKETSASSLTIILGK